MYVIPILNMKQSSASTAQKTSSCLSAQVHYILSMSMIGLLTADSMLTMKTLRSMTNWISAGLSVPVKIF